VIKVLVVDDSALMRKLLGGIFSRQADFELQFARNGLEALELLESFKPDVVTLDIHMPQMDGLACLDRIMIERPCPVVMVSSLTAEGADATLQALRLGAIDFVAKPEGAISLHIDELSDALVTKVRAAATARIRTSARLRERVRHRIGRDAPTIRVEEELRNTAGALFGGLMGGGGGGTSGLVIGVGMGVFHSAPIAVGLLACSLSTFYTIARTIFGRIAQRREKEMSELAGRLEEIAQSAISDHALAEVKPKALRDVARPESA